jgi:hypothetical protein
LGEKIELFQTRKGTIRSPVVDGIYICRSLRGKSEKGELNRETNRGEVEQELGIGGLGSGNWGIGGNNF